MRKFYLLALIISLSVFSVPSILEAQTNDRYNTISVGGEGIIKVEPDIVTVQFGIVTRDEDPVAAQRKNEEAAANALESVRELGVSERKVKVTRLRLREYHEHDRDRRRIIESGYEATREVEIELDDMDKLPRLIATVTQHGANRLSGLAYDISNRDEVRNDALRKAVQQAKEKARIITEELDVSVGRVIRISEERLEFPRPRTQFDMDVSRLQLEHVVVTGRPEAYAAGEIEVKANIHVTFLLE